MKIFDPKLTGSIEILNPIQGNIEITGDLVVPGSITAREFKTELVSASIIYQSGSSQFGDTMDDTHIFTGSVDITGSVKADIAEAIIFQTPKNFTQTYTLPQEYNALLIGPTTLQGQITVTSGSNLTVI